MQSNNIMESKQKNSDNESVLVDYRNNFMLSRHGVSFHWWNADETSMHTHNFYEFFIITEGKTCHELNGVISSAGKNTLCMIRPTDCHQFRKLENESCLHMNLCAVPERLSAICEAMYISLPMLEAQHELSVQLSVSEAAFFIERAKLLSLMLSEDGEEPLSVICELIAEAVSVINRNRLLAKLNYPEWFASLLEKINSPENSACTAADVYHMGGFSPPVMVEYFKKYTGKTVAAYLRDTKCNRAGIMLRSTSLSTLEISTRLGYDSLSHFNRIFKEYYGMPPALYRNKFVEKQK